MPSVVEDDLFARFDANRDSQTYSVNFDFEQYKREYETAMIKIERKAARRELLEEMLRELDASLTINPGNAWFMHAREYVHEKHFEETHDESGDEIE